MNHFYTNLTFARMFRVPFQNYPYGTHAFFDHDQKLLEIALVHLAYF
ncbi:hypothetical protein [Dyadobacter beijingensis]|nr:hypothetical protein [Dyadobacter beijingensis]